MTARLRCPTCLTRLDLADDASKYPRHEWQVRDGVMCSQSYQPLRYFRNKLGTVIHRESCPSRGDTPWFWSEGKSYSEIVKVAAFFPWLRRCRKCLA